MRRRWCARRRLVAGEPADFLTIEQARDEGMTDYLALIHRFAAEGVIGEPDHRESVAQPILERDIFRELVEIVALASDAHPESDARRIPQRR